MPTNQEKLAHLDSLASRTKDPVMLAKITTERARINALMQAALQASFQASQPPAPAALPPAPAVIPPIPKPPVPVAPAPVVIKVKKSVALPPLPSIPAPKPESLGAKMVREGQTKAPVLPPTPASPSGDDRTTPPITSFKPMAPIPMEAKVDTVEHIDSIDPEAALETSILRLARLREQKKLCKPNSNEFWRMKEAIDVERDHYFDLKNKIQEARMVIRDEMYTTFAADQLAAIAELSMVMKTLTSSMNDLSSSIQKGYVAELNEIADLQEARDDLHEAQLAVFDAVPEDAPIKKAIAAQQKAAEPQSLSDQDKEGKFSNAYPQPDPVLTEDDKVAPVGTDRDMTDVITDLIPRLSKQGKRSYCPYCCKYFMDVGQHLVNNKRCNARLVDEYGGN